MGQVEDGGGQGGVPGADQQDEDVLHAIFEGFQHGGARVAAQQRGDGLVIVGCEAAAERADLASVSAIVQHSPHDSEEQASNDSMREHLEHRTGQANGVERGQAKQNETHVTDA